MNKKRLLKFNLYASVVLLLVFILMFVSATVAYFTDTEKASSTFTSGNVEIALSETEYTNDYGAVYPAQIISKDPTITNTGDDAEWIAAKVVLKDGAGDITRVLGYGEDDADNIDIKLLLSGGLLDEGTRFGEWNGISGVRYNEHYAMIQVPNASHNEYIFYFLILAPVEVGDSVVLFEQVNFPYWWDNTEMQELSELEIQVQAFGVQTFQLDSCLTAMVEAFPEHFLIHY